jgi:hypothetical protein
MVALVEAVDDSDHEQGANPCPRVEVGAAECGPHDEKSELEEASHRAHGACWAWPKGDERECGNQVATRHSKMVQIRQR